MKIDLNLMAAENIFKGAIRPVIALAAQADAKGIDQLSCCDHLGFNRAAHAERIQSHGFPYKIDQTWLEPISLLSAFAAVTERALLSSFVMVAPFRPALLLAKQLATLDQLSGGRVNIGLGVGWQKPEFEAAGIQFEGRFGFLEEMIGACRALWGQAPASFQGQRIRFEDFVSLPFPVQGAKLPILLGLAPSPANFDRIARVGDGWSVNPAQVTDLAGQIALVKDAFARHGRDPESCQFATQLGPVKRADGTIDWDKSAAGVTAMRKAGATSASFLAYQFCPDEKAVEPFLDWMADLASK